MRIAVVDDEKIIRDQMKNFIIKQGAKYDVESYDSGQALLKSGFRRNFAEYEREDQSGKHPDHKRTCRPGNDVYLCHGQIPGFCGG